MRPYRLYDPCCGGAYLLTCIGFLHGQEISHIYASDIDHKVISIAEKNLSLLTQEGLKKRIAQIESMYAEFGKESHYEALNSALRVKEILDKGDGRPEIRCFTADVTKARDLTGIVDSVNMVITDLPYGDIVTWSGQLDEKQAVSPAGQYSSGSPAGLTGYWLPERRQIISEKYEGLSCLRLGRDRLPFSNLFRIVYYVLF